ncbi:hypothetical protein MBLNU230_g7614t1 [Neophaeotheca triangularis]
MAPKKVIIDTDPGCDDILAILLALSALPSELEVLLISVTYGNIDVENCLRNVVALFHHIEREIAWRKANGKDEGFECLKNVKPLVAVGPEKPLTDAMLMADFFHGTDGLGGVHESHPHLTPAETWKDIVDAADKSDHQSQHDLADELRSKVSLFTPSRVAGHDEILRLLREHQTDEITIVAVGPLTNCAMAAAQDPETFLKVKEVVVMGGNVNHVGNMTPVAEFNTFADSVAAARLYALTSPQPATTMPPTLPTASGLQNPHPHPPHQGPYPPEKLWRQLSVTLFPLDITSPHVLTRGEYNTTMQPLLAAGSPLAEWTHAWLSATFAKVETLQTNVSGDAVGLELHDPLCVWYVLTSLEPSIIGKDRVAAGGWELVTEEDVRVETTGQWTRGMCVTDGRSRRRREEESLTEVPGDTGNWLSARSGNRLRRCVKSPGEDVFGTYLLGKVFGI